ncbi:hypothetical protein ASPCAL09188 [Aspergillus calidoustus]|uniref:BZIP domain-containing protein n=1 Tax=Aspergillus calidoustus TaxID=454130 RepID=A0A0U5GV48_ASPCI|nr:hypothetical protein ASPCAL09188 [Aspergillus calidoustus]
MATLAEHPAVAPASYDQDIESFLHLDQLTYTPSEQARSKIGLPTQPSLPSSDFVSSDARSSSFASSSQSPVAFPAPSHQYDEHKQQTGLPPGALAQAMPIAHIPQMGFSAPSPGFAMNGEMFQPQIKTDVALDFNSTPSRNHSEMDLEADSSMNTAPAFFFSPNVKPNQYIDPNALGGQEVFSMGPSTQVGRMYPGMHQRAAMAKAAQQQREHDLVRHQQPQQLLQQPHNPGTPQTQHPRVSNPLVDERISRLLQQMKAGSASPSDSSPSPSSMPQMAKSRKDEQDMDEDERLLASEEGKKLSSKERRQLRNKVSARAFRSRRKEYIGHLESEVQQRNNEVQELRTQNRALFEENARLTDLARTLLSSPHFSQVLDEMNISGLPAVPPQQPHQQPQPQPQPSAIPQPQMQPQNIPKEPTPNHPQQEFALQQSSQMGMMMVPSQGIDVAAMNMNNGGWNTGIDLSFGNPSVFAVFEVPEPPVLDTEALTGKSSTFSEVNLPEVSIKERSQLESLPSVDGQTPADAGDLNVEIDESDPVLALFADQPKQSVTAVPCESSPTDIEMGKPTLELIVDGASSSAASRLDYLCHSMEAAFQRVTMMTAHLS